jgi:hypothetical protein
MHGQQNIKTSHWIIQGALIPSTLNMPHAARLLNRQDSCIAHIHPLLMILTFLLSQLNFWICFAIKMLKAWVHVQMNTTLLWVVSGAFLDYYAASSGNILPAFRDDLSVPSWRAKGKMWPMGFPETSVRNCHYLLRDDPEECSFHYSALVNVSTTSSKFRFIDRWVLRWSKTYHQQQKDSIFLKVRRQQDNSLLYHLMLIL